MPPRPAAGDESGDEAPIKDSDGVLFQDFGFLSRAEEHKSKGNDDFKKGDFLKALRSYDMALEVLEAVLQDSAIVMSEKKYAETVVLNGTLHLNKSTCHFKLKNWSAAVREAAAALAGGDAVEMKYADPYIGGKVPHPDSKLGYMVVAYVEKRLPQSVQGKAWFRMAKCYTQMGFPIRAKHITLKARELLDGDKGMSEEISQLWKQICALKRKQKDKQARQFEGYFDKLGLQGGYMTKKAANLHQWGQMTYDQKVKQLEKLDDDDNEDDDEFHGSGGGAAPATTAYKVPAAAEEGEVDPALGINLDSVISLRQQEAEARAAAWRQTYEQRRQRLGAPDRRKQKQTAEDRKTRLICLDNSSDEEAAS